MCSKECARLSLSVIVIKDAAIYFEGGEHRSIPTLVPSLEFLTRVALKYWNMSDFHLLKDLQ